jgi:hypothetical protein
MFNLIKEYSKSEMTHRYKKCDAVLVRWGIRFNRASQGPRELLGRGCHINRMLHICKVSMHEYPRLVPYRAIRG